VSLRSLASADVAVAGRRVTKSDRVDLADSGRPWLGAVPRRWKTKRLKFAATRNNKKIAADESNLPYLGLENVESAMGRATHSEAENCATGLANYFGSGDVLFGRLRPYLAKVLEADTEGVCSTEFLVLRPSHQLYSRFLLYYMLAPNFIDVVSASTYGAKMPRASWENIGNLPLLLPSLDEQRAIAAFLDRETTRIDALIAKKQRLIELLEEKRNALISRAVTKGLNPDAPMKQSGDSCLPEVPAHWQLWSVRHLVQTRRVEIQDGNHGELHPTASDYVSTGIPFLMANDIRLGRINTSSCKFISEERAQNLRIGFARSGDVLLTHKGTVGETALAPDCLPFPFFMLTPQVTYYRSLNSEIHSYYLYLSMLSGYFQDQLASLARQQTTRAYVGLLDQKQLRILLPPLTEQKAIIESLTEPLRKLFALQDMVGGGIDRLREYRTALISAAVTGKIDVRGEAA